MTTAALLAPLAQAGPVIPVYVLELIDMSWGVVGSSTFGDAVVDMVVTAQQERHPTCDFTLRSFRRPVRMPLRLPIR